MDKNRYALLYGYLLARIYFGFYPKGKALPSIYRLSEMFGVSTITSREAIRLLKEKGYGEEAMHSMDYHAYKEKQYQILANAVRENMDMKKIYEILEEGVQI